ncbi:MAG: hypothetical protein JXQ29_06725 [Planctomycetes bacterium]|nr:hypothetical protein [Planctomycetota bacterium]
MNLAIVTPELCGRGGSEIYLLECLRRWQQVLPVTLYTGAVRAALLEEFGIDRERVAVVPLGCADPADRRPVGGSAVARPRERPIGAHDLYFFYRLPAPLVARRPSVWFPAPPEPAPEDLRSPEAACAGAPVPGPRRPWDGGASRAAGAALFDRLATHSRAAGCSLECLCGRAPDLIAPPGTEPVTWDRTAEALLALFCRTARRRSAVQSAGHRVTACGAPLAQGLSRSTSRTP